MSLVTAKGHDPLVSIIIPTFNSAPFIRECLNSVLAQGFHDYEILVIDDGSNDETRSIVESLGSGIHFIAQENKGPAAARNHGLRIAKGEWVCFLDSDDLWLPDKLEKQVRFAQDNPQYGLITTEACTFDAHGVLEPKLKTKLYQIRNGYVVQDLLFGNWIQTSGVMVRRECFRTVGHFHEERGLRGTDWIMWMQIAARYPIYFLEEPLAKIRILSTSFSHGDPEKQFWTLFRALDIIRESIPSLSPRLINKAASTICYNRAIRDGKDGLLANARKKLWYAIRLRPWDGKLWLALAACSSRFTWNLASAAMSLGKSIAN